MIVQRPRVCRFDPGCHHMALGLAATGAGIISPAQLLQLIRHLAQGVYFLAR